MPKAKSAHHPVHRDEYADAIEQCDQHAHRRARRSAMFARFGTWHCRYTRTDTGWRIKILSVKMWTDTAFNSGIAIQDRKPGMVGTGTPFG